jgi:RNA polymerase sigma-70 factor, ECF subfamily
MLPSVEKSHSIWERPRVDHDALNARFQTIVLSNLDAAHNLAWWLTRDDHEAADVVQDACMKAWRNIAAFRGGDSKAWLLSIVRTTAYSRMRQRRPVAHLDEDALNLRNSSDARSQEPLTELLRQADREIINQAIMVLPDTYREVLVLRDLEGLSYAHIAAVIEIPVGTVMSRLSRARDAVRDALLVRLRKE